MTDLVYNYKGQLYPQYLKHHNMMQYIEPVARRFCIGLGLDIGCGPFPLPGAIPIDPVFTKEFDAWHLPNDRLYDYIFSSHCLEHLEDPEVAMDLWITHLRRGGCLFLYLPHPDMLYWQPVNCPRHLHIWRPGEVHAMLHDRGMRPVIHSERDMAWSFSVVGFKS